MSGSEKAVLTPEGVIGHQYDEEDRKGPASVVALKPGEKVPEIGDNEGPAPVGNDTVVIAEHKGRSANSRDMKTTQIPTGQAWVG